MDPELGEKRKVAKERKKSHKKQKDIRDPPAELTTDHCNLLTDRMVEIANEKRQRIDAHDTDLIGGIANLLQSLCIMVKEVRITISRAPSKDNY